MHKITKINNATHEVEITHSSGAKHTFIIPEEARKDDVEKILHVKKQMDLHALRLQQSTTAPAKPPDDRAELLSTIKLLHTVLAIETLVLIALAIRILHG
jgi:hypothetical protein